MSSEARQLDAEQVLGLLHELSERLAAGGVQAQLFVVGGAARALAYDQGRLTRDVDALFVPALEVRVAAGEIGAAHGLEPDWLNDAAKGFLPGPDEHPQTVFESESLLVQVASPEYLLAMKLHASRDERDLDDASTLFNRLGYTTAQEAVDLLSRTYRQRNCSHATTTSPKTSPSGPPRGERRTALKLRPRRPRLALSDCAAPSRMRKGKIRAVAALASVRPSHPASASDTPYSSSTRTLGLST